MTTRLIKSASPLLLFLTLVALALWPLVAAAEEIPTAPRTTSPVAQVQQVQGAPRLTAPTPIKLREEKKEEEEKPNPFEESLKGNYPNLATQAVALTLMALMPFLIMILSSFTKIVVVLSLLRNALGAQQAPPNQVLNGVALLLSIYIMFPTGVKMYDAAEEAINATTQAQTALVSSESASQFIQIAAKAREPLRDFLRANSIVNHQKMFYRSVYRSIPEEYRSSLKPEDFIILVPSFIATQLKEAFEIGVLIYIPFFVIDLVTANILLAMGMMMLSPVTISLPLKLFLLVMLDGWTILIQGLVTTFK